MPTYTQVKRNVSPNTEPYWINLIYPNYNGIIHFSYKEVKDNLAEVLEDSRKLAYKHSIKADAIGEKLFISPEKKVYGILYDIKGDAASSIQFFLTDSARHFIRGSLYFNNIPNKDSLAPVVNFVKEDIIHLMETFKWKSPPNTK
jgi:gliding motility-associated lipoprotein GldD